MKISIKDYSTLRSISLQAVYQSCAKGKIKCIEENGKKYVVVNADEIKPLEQSIEQPLDKSVEKA